VECGPRRQAAPRPRPAGRALQLGRDILVEPGRRLGEVPGAPIGVSVGVGSLAEHAVDALAFFRCRRAIDCRTHQRMTKANLGAEIDQAGGGRRRSRVRLDAELGGRPPYQQRVPDRLGRRHEEQEPGRCRQRRQPLTKDLLDPSREHRGVGEAEPAGEIGRGTPPRELEKSQRVAARLGHDPVTHPFVEGSGYHAGEKFLGGKAVQPGHGELRQALEMTLAARLAHREDQPDRLGTEPASHERQRLRGGRVQPLGVVHYAEEGSRLGDVR
jgi:hypothetical protein